MLLIVNQDCDCTVFICFGRDIWKTDDGEVVKGLNALFSKLFKKGKQI